MQPKVKFFDASMFKRALEVKPLELIAPYKHKKALDNKIFHSDFEK
jgi:hypothetical protein